MDKQNLLRSFEVCIGTDSGRNVHRVIAKSSMAAYSWALRQCYDSACPPRSLVVKPAAS